jgi:hypothetical protein
MGDVHLDDSQNRAHQRVPRRVLPPQSSAPLGGAVSTPAAAARLRGLIAIIFVFSACASAVSPEPENGGADALDTDVASDVGPADTDPSDTDPQDAGQDAVPDNGTDPDTGEPEDADRPDSADTNDPDAQDGADIADAADADGDVADANDADVGPGLPTLADLWAGRARFAVDRETGAIGPEGMHFLSTWWMDGQLWAYYIRNIVIDGVGRSATGLALSPDGVRFEDQGVVFQTGGSWDQSWWGQHPALGHNTGVADGDGWGANTADHAEGHMVYGPYVADLGPGPQTASFQLLVDVVDADDDVVATIDVFDANVERVLATRDLRRSDFDADFQYKIFNLDYVQVGGHRMEFRVFYHRRALVRVRTVAVAQGHAPFPDDRLASFPGVWRDGSTWHLVYEAAGTDRRWPGDVALATSADGHAFTRHNPNPLLRHLDGGWEDVNIGTPSLWKEGDTWYLFYHGYDGTDVQIGVASGPSLDGLTRHPANPIVRTSGNGWDSGTVGARSIIRDGSAYYMAYEGSTEAPFDRADWSTGIARSTDLVSWQKFSGNPVLPVTTTSFGFDGPEWVRTPDGHLHIYYRDPGPGNRTWRATLVWQ